eukprot:m.78037 g.78037  ORF g.78037 m.78037 type:complete len:63 (-) comp10651_c0_seq1:9363-9551(-)
MGEPRVATARSPSTAQGFTLNDRRTEIPVVVNGLHRLILTVDSHCLGQVCALTGSMDSIGGD